MKLQPIKIEDSQVLKSRPGAPGGHFRKGSESAIGMGRTLTVDC